MLNKVRSILLFGNGTLRALPLARAIKFFRDLHVAWIQLVGSYLFSSVVASGLLGGCVV